MESARELGRRSGHLRLGDQPTIAPVRGGRSPLAVPGKILVIRGGAVGDFILTLPAIGLLRDAFPDSRLEILGYRHIIALAEKRHYADAVRCIEYAPLAAFFNPAAELDTELAAYFASFDQVISYLFDPDGHFAANLRRAGVKHLIQADPRIRGEIHASAQLAAPLQQLALFLDEAGSQIFPLPEDFAAADELLLGAESPRIALHPGSGSPKKTWCTTNWIQLIQWLQNCEPGHSIVIVGGESDQSAMRQLREAVGRMDRVRILENHPLPSVAAVLGRCDIFLGHDSGISHLAAAAGCRCALLFGPTDPEVWAPANDGVQIVASPTGEIADIHPDRVRGTITGMLETRMCE